MTKCLAEIGHAHIFFSQFSLASSLYRWLLTRKKSFINKNLIRLTIGAARLLDGFCPTIILQLLRYEKFSQITYHLYRV